MPEEYVPEKICLERHKGVDGRLKKVEEKNKCLFEKLDEVKDGINNKINRAMYALFALMGALILNLLYMIINNNGK